MAESAGHTDVEMRINEHLEAIDKALAAKGVPLTERRSVTGDVEAQIREMLSARIGGSPTPTDIEAIIRKLDAPESYAEEAGAATVGESPSEAEATPSRLSRTAVVGAAWAPLPFICFWLYFTPSMVIVAAGQPPPQPSAMELVAAFTLMAVGLLGPFGATILGWVAVGQIRRSNGLLYGLALAVADGLIFPLLLLDVLIYLLWRVVIAVAISCPSLGFMQALGRPNYSMADGNPMLIFILAAASALVCDWLIVRLVWRAVKVAGNDATTAAAGKMD